MLQKKGLDASVDALIDYLDPTKSQTWNVGQLRGWARVSITAYLGVVEAPDAIDAMCLVMWFSMKAMPGHPL